MRRALVLLSVPLLFVGTAVASAATSVVAVSGPSPFLGCSLDGDPGGGVNYRNTEVEPWLAVNPANPDNLIGSWQQDRWSNGGAVSNLSAYSKNGGASFTSVVLPGQTICSGGASPSPGGTIWRASDPWVTVSPDGTAYQMSLVETKLSSGLNNPSGMAVSKSTDGGATWSAPTFIAYDTDPSIFNDKNSITADPTRDGYVYAVWDRLDSPPGKGSVKSAENTSGYRGPTVLARTTDAGQTWSTPQVIYSPGTNNQTIGNQIVVLPNGTLVNLFMLIRNNNKGQVKGYSVAAIRSTDAGVTWSARPTIVSSVSFAPVTDPETGVGLRTADLIPQVAAGADGTLAVVWQDSRWGGHSHVAFSRSTDGGTTWSSPTQIDAAPAGAAAFTPGVAIGPSGRIGVSYYDTRNNDASPGLPTDYWFTSCTSSCTSASSWTEQHVDGPFDMENAPIARGYFLGDYEGLVAMGSDFGLLFARSGTTPASADVVFARVTP